MNRRTLFLIAGLVMMLVIPTAIASAQSLDITGLTTTLFDAVNSWIPSLGPILVIGPAIAIAVLVIGLIVISIRNGIKSASGGAK